MEYVAIADADGTKPHRYPLAFDPQSGELMWKDETDPDQLDNDGNPLIPGKPVSHTWQRFDGGMGKTVEDGESGYYFGENWYVTPYGLRPRPTISTVTLTGNSTPIEWMFEAEAADGTGFVYILAGTKILKLLRSGRTLWTSRDLATESETPVFGHPDEWNSIWHLPCGQDVDFKRILTVVDDLAGAFLISGAQTESTFELAADASDGYLRKSSSVSYAAARAATATVNPVTTQLNVGQSLSIAGTYYIQRSYLQYATGTTIPDGDTIYSAKLRLYMISDNTGTDFTIQVRAFNWGGGLTAGDWRATPSGDTLVGSFSTADLPAGQDWIEIIIDTTAINKVDGESTYFYLLSSLDDDDPGTAPTAAEYVAFEAREHTGAHAAQLIVTHGTTATITDNTAAANVSGGTAFTLLADNVDDVFYWGCDTLFDGLFLNIVTPCDTALTLDWEFWNGSAWTDIIGPETDDTGGLLYSGWVTWASASQTAWAKNAVNGVTAYWVRVKTATAITTPPTANFTPPADVITASGGENADHFCAAGNLLFRSNGRVIDACAAADATVAGNWGGDYNVGRVGETITDLLAVGDELGVCTNLNFYLFDGVGVSRPMLGKNKPASTENGKGALQFFDWTLLPYGGLYRYAGGGAIPFGPDAIKGFGPVNGITSEPVKLTHYGLDHCENVVYLAAKDSQSTPYYHLFKGVREPEAERLRLDTLIYTATVIKVVFVDSTPTLWFSYGNNVAYIALTKDGKPEGGTFGQISLVTNTKLYLGETDFGTTAPKRLIALEVQSRNNVGAHLQLAGGISRDAGTPTAIGNPFYTDGLAELFWTTGTNDTARRMRVYVWWVASADYTPIAAAPEIFSVTLRAEVRPEQGDIITMGTILLDDNDGTAEGKLTRLKAAASASTAKKVWDPDGNVIYATVIKVKRAELAAEKGKPPQRAAVVFLRRSDVA